jgi:hypothetical protein
MASPTIVLVHGRSRTHPAFVPYTTSFVEEDVTLVAPPNPPDGGDEFAPQGLPRVILR